MNKTNQTILTSSVAGFIVLSLHTIMFTPEIVVTERFVRPIKCVVGPKLRPDIQWEVEHISANKVRFKSGQELYRNAVTLNGC